MADKDPWFVQQIPSGIKGYFSSAFVCHPTRNEDGFQQTFIEVHFLGVDPKPIAQQIADMLNDGRIDSEGLVVKDQYQKGQLRRAKECLSAAKENLEYSQRRVDEAQADLDRIDNGS